LFAVSQALAVQQSVQAVAWASHLQEQLVTVEDSTKRPYAEPAVTPVWHAVQTVADEHDAQFAGHAAHVFVADW